MKLIGSKLGLIGSWLILISLGLTSAGCNDDPTNGDVYYVKYEIESQSIYVATRYAQINFEDNTSTTFNVNSGDWETTIGPVKKGFNAKLIGGYTDPNISNSYIDAKIHISKNNGPFALKKFDTSSTARTLVEIDYTIDF